VIVLHPGQDLEGELKWQTCSDWCGQNLAGCQLKSEVTWNFIDQ